MVHVLAENATLVCNLLASGRNELKETDNYNRAKWALKLKFVEGVYYTVRKSEVSKEKSKAKAFRSSQ